MEQLPDKLDPLRNFLLLSSDDSRISTAHISLYAVLWRRWYELENAGPLVCFSYEIMPACKISSHSTYHRTIRQLQEYGYIHYVPSFNRFTGSRVVFL